MHRDRFFYCRLHSRIWLNIFLREWILVFRFFFLWFHLLNEKRIVQECHSVAIVVPELERKDMGLLTFLSYTHNLPSDVTPLQVKHSASTTTHSPYCKRFSTGGRNPVRKKHSHTNQAKQILFTRVICFNFKTEYEEHNRKKYYAYSEHLIGCLLSRHFFTCARTSWRNILWAQQCWPQ